MEQGKYIKVQQNENANAQAVAIKRHRGKKTKEGFYFGPFASAGSANWTIK